MIYKGVIAPSVNQPVLLSSSYRHNHKKKPYQSDAVYPAISPTLWHYLHHITQQTTLILRLPYLYFCQYSYAPYLFPS